MIRADETGVHEDRIVASSSGRSGALWRFRVHPAARRFSQASVGSQLGTWQPAQNECAIGPVVEQQIVFARRHNKLMETLSVAVPGDFSFANSRRRLWKASVVIGKSRGRVCQMTYTVTYHGNGSDGGSPPVDPASPYAAGVTVSVLPAGTMTKTGAVFAYWNTKADGSGTFHGWPQDTTFTMPAANVDLYAQWFVTTGLPNGGATTHYTFAYDSNLANGGLEPARTIKVMAACDADFAIMAAWFKNVTITNPAYLPIKVYVTALYGGANTTDSIRLKPNGTNVDELRAYLVSEVTEIFMHAQNLGWGYVGGVPDEESCGEALSLFLTQQFEILQNTVGGPYTAFSGTGWLNTSLPASNAAQTRYTYNPDGSLNTDFGDRFDYVNSTLPYPGNGPGTGCSILFIYYLFHQLGFKITEIIAAAPGFTNGNLNATACLRGVYQNLTTDDSDPFPFFKQLLDTAYPPNLVSAIPGPAYDDPWPLALFQYWNVKDTYGSDEVSDILKNSSGVYPNGFSLSLEGFNTQVVGSQRPVTPTIAFGGVTTAPDTAAPITYQFTNPKIPQRILFNYDVHFASPPALGPFPASGETPAAGASSIKVLGQSFPAACEFFFLAGADPYFTNVQLNPLDPSATNVDVPWLSQDLRVFTATPGQPGGKVPVPSAQYVAPPAHPVPAGAPSFVENNTYGDYDISGAYDYITRLIAYLNQGYGDPSKGDPFDVNNSILPGQLTAYTGDSSVTPGTKANNTTYNNYSFAIARVRLRGTAGPTGAADGVKVFFRLWQTQTADTDWNPGYTYLSDDLTGLNPQYPKAPSDNHTIPFFASGNYPVVNDTPNNQTITIEQSDQQWAYFGCFLNLYDSSFTVNSQNVQQQFAQGDHHCLVAQIAFKPSPIRNVGATGETTENCDLLAQRNLQVSTSANPGTLATHRIPQTFDIRPTAPATGPNGAPSQPDELMINWGNTPVGCVASIYWPGANAADVVSLASRMYGSQALSVADPHTIQCKTSRTVTYVPIPPGAGESLAGLLTIDLPANVVKGQEFNVVVRRIGTRKIKVAAPPPPPPPPPPPRLAIDTSTATSPAAKPAAHAKAALVAAPQSARESSATERYVVGSFQIKIPVKTKEAMLPAEETALAIFRARLAAMSVTNRWRPVLERYLGLLEARVDGLGGDANAIPPSFLGYQGKGSGGREGGKDSGHDGGHDGGHEGGRDGGREGRDDGARAHLERTGKIAGLIFDHFGDFEGFILESELCEHRFFSRETEIRTLAERVWEERLRITVWAERDEPHRPLRIIVRQPPAPFTA
jgi:hypothetical protein